MQYKDIKCIDESWLDGKIEMLQNTQNDTTDLFVVGHIAGEIRILEEIKQHLTSATPILEKAFEAGIEAKINKYDHEIQESKEYFLHTEVNI